MQDLPDQTQRMLDFYGLAQNPFGEEVDATVFSSAGERSEVAEQLKHLLTFSPQDCLVMAPPGGGKRTLAQQVLKRLDDEWRAAWIDARETEQLDTVTRELIGQLGLGLKADGDTASLYANIADVIGQRTADGENFLLIVENADQLDSEMQQWLQSLRSLTGQVDNRLRQLWLAASATAIEQAENDDQWYPLVLEPFTGEDAFTYLKDRFAAAGQLEGVPIDAKDVNRLNDMAGGIPGELNQVVQDYLIAGTFKTTERQQGFPLTHVLAGAAVVTLIVLGILYSNQPSKGEGEETAEVAQETENDAAANTSDVQQRLAEAVARVESRRQSSDQEEAVPAGEAAQASDQEDSAPLPGDSSATEDSPQQAQPPAESEVPAEPQTQPEEAGQESTEAEPVTNDDDWLESAPGSHYTLQLLGVRERKSVEDLVAELDNPERYRIVASTYDGKPWYVLVRGQYKDAEAAREAIQELPEKFGGQSPWPRTIASLRASMR